jgi:hypothetical protein
MQPDLFRPASDLMERRSAEVELRAKGRTLHGYAAVFDIETDISGAYREIIRAGAFRRSLASGRDILGLVNHDPAAVLARTRSGSLKLSEDLRGLAFELAVPDTSAGRDVLELAQRGDLGGMSFAFSVPDKGDEWRGKNRTLVDIDLFEVSVITSFAAYAATEVNVRNARGGRSRLILAQRYLDTIGA